MKFLLLGDTHFSSKRPERRLDDDYFITMMGKLIQVVKIYRDNNCDLFIQVGDFFDSYAASNMIKATLISFLREAMLKIYCVYGQHDISGHSATTFQSSPLRVLEAAGVVDVLDSPFSRFSKDGGRTFDDVCIYGASFGNKVIDLDIDPEHKMFNILVTHQMIGDEVLFPGQNIQHPMAFLRSHKCYDLIVCGDYHYRFIVETGGRYCVNPGAMIRKTISDRDLEHKPAVLIFDTDKRTCEVIKLKVELPELIFDMSRKKIKEEEDCAALLKFIENLKKKQGTTIGWKEILLHVFDEKKVGTEVRQEIDECILEVEK